MPTVLDIGSGIRPQRVIAGFTVSVEPCAEYAEILRREHPELVVVNALWSEVPRLFAPGSFDHVTILDVIEHLDKDEGRRLLNATIPIARLSVRVFTPLGFLAQEPGEGGIDAWGLHGGEWQRHRSGWTEADFVGWSFTYDSPCFMAVLDKGA